MIAPERSAPRARALKYPPESGESDSEPGADERSSS
jgi:hypothetical protein